MTRSRRREAPSDPVFAAEMEAIAAARREREAARRGHGRPVDEAGQPCEPNPSWRSPAAGFNDVRDLRSVFRPTGVARE